MKHLRVLLILVIALLPLLATAGEPVRHIVEFDEAPLARFTGDARFKATDPSVTGAAHLDLDQKDQRAYLDHLDLRQAVHLHAAKVALGRELPVRHRYRVLLNGVALDLTEAEAQKLSRLPGVRALQRADAELRIPLSDAGPAWVGAEAVWQGMGGMPASRGEGVVVGIIDTGINETHPSFAATDGEGYVHTNPRGQFFGQCMQSPSRCNAKLIGIYDFTDEGNEQGRDLDGHGSHVAGTAVGNVLNSTIQGHTVNLPLRLSGVAPRASLISYKACTNEPRVCPFDALFAALEQAAVDGVQVINYSIGGMARDPWIGVGQSSPTTDAKLMLAARNAGITVVAAAGNSGPGQGSVGSPANAPWVLAVANTSHDRRFTNTVRGLSGGATAPPADLVGVGISAGVDQRDIVHAADFGFPLCSQGDDIDFPPSGASNPWPAGTFNGQIVVCDRGVTARVTKGFNLMQAGAGGMILVNMPADGGSIVSDDHYLPATHLGASDGAVLKTWLASGSGHRGRLSGLVAESSAQHGDVLAISSSRGPSIPHDSYLKPDLSAPGSSILAASGQGSGFASLTGTSMAAPHVSGAAALLKALHPGWTPSMIESVLVASLRPSVRLPDGVAAADALAQGGGALDVAGATTQGLYFDVSAAEFQAANPQAGGDPGTLNRPTLYQRTCFQTCSFTRRVTSLLDHSRTWTADGVDFGDAQVSVQPSSFTLAAGASQVLTIHVDVRDAGLPGSWVEGRVRLRPASGGNSVGDTLLPALLFAHPGNVPAQIAASSSSDRGVLDVGLSGLVALPQARFEASRLVRGEQRARVLPRHEEASSPFNGAAGTWTELSSIAAPGPAGGKVMFAAQASGPSPHINLYLGLDSDGDGLASRNEILCSALARSGNKQCRVEIDFAPGASAKVAWILVQNVSAASESGDRIDLEFHAAPLIAGDSAHAVFAPGHALAGQGIPLRLAWDEPRMRPGEPWFSYLSLGTRPDTLGQTARIPVRIARGSAVGSPKMLAHDGRTLRVGLPGHGRHEGAFIDVPPGATRLVLESLGSGQIDLYAMRRELPGNGSGPQIEAPPPIEQAVASDTSTGSATRRIELAGTALTPGRWYLTPTSRSGAPLEIDLRATLEFAGAAPLTADGAWHNPARDGHGFFLSRGGGQWALLWYSYDHANQPQWFIIQAEAPAPGERVWRAPMFRFAFDGEASHGAEVGQVTLTRVADHRLLFVWQVDGFSGSELMHFIDPGPCPERNGQPFNPTGLWFPPEAPGSGFNVLASSGVEVVVLYVYDGAGMPRWLYASADTFDSGPLSLLQMRGFCRDCAFQPITGQAAGSVSIDYQSVATGQALIDAGFSAPLSGGWSTARTVATLSAPLACP